VAVEFSLELLKDEIVVDSLGLGYKNSATPNDWKEDSVIVNIINNADGANPRTVTRDRISSGDIRSDILFEAFQGLATAQESWLVWLTSGSSEPNGGVV